MGADYFIQFIPFSSFRRRPESGHFNNFWIQGQVRDDDGGAFYEAMTKDEVRRVLAEMGDGHLLMAKLLYGCGLRLMECIRLHFKDLDFERRMIYIRAGKGDKDRVTVFPNNLMEDLHDQVEVVRTLHDQDVS